MDDSGPEQPLWFVRSSLILHGAFWLILIVAAVGILRHPRWKAQGWLALAGSCGVLALLGSMAIAFWSPGGSSEIRLEPGTPPMTMFLIGGWGLVMAVIGFVLALLSEPRPPDHGDE